MMKFYQRKSRPKILISQYICYENFHFSILGLTGEAFIQERKDGLLHRSWVAGVSPFEIVFAQISTQIFVLIGQTFVALLMTLLVFGINCEGSIFIVIALTLLQGIAGMCYGRK